jgi:cell division protein FtsB
MGIFTRRPSALSRFAQAFQYDLETGEDGGLRALVSNEEIPVSTKQRAPLPQTTIVGDLVGKMDRTYRAYLDRKHQLTAYLADATEQLRQTDAAILAIEAAMTTLADEVALTPDERKAAKNAADSRFDAAVERDLFEVVHGR